MRGRLETSADYSAGNLVPFFGDIRSLGVGRFYLVGFYGNGGARLIFEGNIVGKGVGGGPVQQVLADGNLLDAAVSGECRVAQGLYRLRNGKFGQAVLGEGFFSDGDYRGGERNTGQAVLVVGPFGDGCERGGNSQGFGENTALGIPGYGDC